MAHRPHLAKLYRATGGGSDRDPDATSWDRREGWLEASDLNDWEGVQADSEGHLIELAAQYNGLKGRLTGLHLMASHLMTLNVEGNR